MKIESTSAPAASLAVAAVAVYCFEDDPASSGSVALLPDETRNLLAELKEGGELKGKAFERTLLHRPAGLAAQKLLVVGAGKKEKFTTFQLGRLAGAAVRHLRARGIREMAWLAGNDVAPEQIESVVEGAALADYDSDPYRTERNGDFRVDSFLIAGENLAASDEVNAAVERGRAIGEAANFTRTLVNEPANRMTPSTLAQQAREMAGRSGLDFEELGEEEIRNLKMEAFLAVAQGSDQPPRLLVLRYSPPDAPESPVIGLIGKGITFDSGGISLKSPLNMHEMKTDMAGGATMLGVMQAIAQIKPKVRVIAVIPATENMPSGKACRPGDVVTSMSGKTVEILNTDAEGRLALADSLTYARQLGCNVLIDAATLTGAIVVALGNITTGVFGRNQEWVDRVVASGSETGERMWQMPVDDDYRDLFKSSIADLANTGGRPGGSITAAMFVGEFAEETPWVHMDIAGTAWSNDEKPWLAKGPTGVPVRTLVHLLTHLGGKLPPDQANLQVNTKSGDVADRTKITFGYPEEWQAFVDRHPEFLPRFRNIERAIDIAFKRTFHSTGLLDRTVYFLGRLIAEEFMEILLLCANGYGIGAQKLLRGMYERAVTVRYLRDHPEELENYLTFHKVAAHKLLKAVEETMGKDILSPEQAKQIEQEFNEVKGRFLVTDCKVCKTTRLNNTWSKCDMVSMTRMSGDLQRLLVPAYYEPTRELHSTMGAIFSRLDPEAVDRGEGLVFDGSAQHDRADRALLAAHHIVLNVLDLEKDLFRLDALQPILQSCFQDFLAIWKK